MDGRKRRSVPEVKTTHMRGTGAPHATTGTTIRTRSGRVKLRNRHDTESKGRTWPVAPRGLLLYDPLRNGEELQHLRQRIISSRKIPSPLENVPGRSTTSSSHPHRSLQPIILEGAKEDQPKNCSRVSGATRIQLRTQTRSRKQKREVRRTLQVTRL